MTIKLLLIKSYLTLIRSLKANSSQSISISPGPLAKGLHLLIKAVAKKAHMRNLEVLHTVSKTATLGSITQRTQELIHSRFKTSTLMTLLLSKI
jgi:hypothetical protein